MTFNTANYDENVLEIGAINIRLPAEFRQRADYISRQVAKHLSRLNIRVSDNIELNQLNIGPINHQKGETDGVLARRIAEQISKQIQHAAPVDISDKQQQQIDSVVPSVNHSVNAETNDLFSTGSSSSNKGMQEGM